MTVGRAIAVVAAAALALPATSAAQGRPVVGGGSFNTAPLLGPGGYTDTVAAGETVYWKVSLAKGQILKVKATVDTSQIQTNVAADDYMPGLTGLTYHLRIFSPLREDLSEEGPGYSSAKADLEGSSGATAKTGTATGPRVLGFEQILASDYNVDKFPAPGEWYISLSAADSKISPAEIPLELPVDLDVQVIGPPQPSSPDFAKSLPGPSKAPSQPSQPSSPGGTAALTDLTANEPADPALTIALVAVIALIGGLGLGALAFVVVGAGRRRSGP